MMRKNRRCLTNRFLTAVLCLPLICGMTAPALAAQGEWDAASRYMVEKKIYQGDENGNLNLESGLTRAELAVILTRLDFLDVPDDWKAWGEERFSDPATRLNKFTDIPDWALPYIEYCYQRGLMKGVAETSFDPRGKVNPQMACTVILRYCGIPETDSGWSYATSVTKAQSLGIAPEDGMDSAAVLRGTMAVILYRGILYDKAGASPAQPTEPAPTQTETPDHTQTPGEQAPAMTIDEMKAEIIRLTNGERVKAGVPELEVLPELMDCAQAKADDMLANHYFGHTSPRYGSANDMVKTLVPGYKGACENINLGGITPSEVIEGWVISEEHYKNMIDTRVTHIGVGIVENSTGTLIWVQQLMRK